ncbi:restriction endonuclease subunit S [Micromonospora zamorensis]|uniref:restriction endonuclease subunit S n=1 Tax=Micromonospora zamorensis TaxID=709883 RepID=UPI003D93FCB2
MRLADVAAINPKLTKRPDVQEMISFVPMAGVDAEAATVSSEPRAFNEVRKSYTLFEDGDLLLAKITPCFENGKIAQASLGYRTGAGSTEFHVIRPDLRQLDSRYLLHFLRQPSIRALGERRMTGSGGQRRVPEAFVAELKLPLPNVTDQQRIADVLDRLADLRAMRREAVAMLTDLERSVFLDMFGDPGRNPHSWPILRVENLLDSASYGTSEKASLVGDVAVLRMGNLTYEGSLDLTDLKYLPSAVVEDRHLVRAGDVLFNRTNSADLVGKTATYRGQDPMAYAGYLVRLRVNEHANPEYLSAYLNTRYCKRVLRGMAKSIVGMANINAKEVQGIAIPKPPLSLQEKFANRIMQIERLRSDLRVHLAELDALFASLQDKAFRGGL